jgi:hypothetical protein
MHFAIPAVSLAVAATLAVAVPAPGPASAKLVAAWGVDYLRLAKYDGRWMIVNVLWRSPPAAPPRP